MPYAALLERTALARVGHTHLSLACSRKLIKTLTRSGPATNPPQVEHDDGNESDGQIGLQAGVRHPSRQRPGRAMLAQR